MRGVKYTLSQNNTEGLTFTSYLMRQIHLEPGETFTEPLRDADLGFMKDWGNSDITTFYSRYSPFGLTTEVVTNATNIP